MEYDSVTKKNQNHVICGKVDGVGDSHIKKICNTQKRQIFCIFPICGTIRKT